MSAPYPRKPDYRLGAMLKDRGLKNKSNVGAAWTNADGTINIVLDPFITLRQEGDLLLTLFPVEPV